MCPPHAKKLILSDSPMKVGAQQRKAEVPPECGEVTNVPVAPFLDLIPVEVDVNRLPIPTESISTGSTNSLRDGELNEIGRRIRQEHSGANTRKSERSESRKDSIDSGAHKGLKVKLPRNHIARRANDSTA